MHGELHGLIHQPPCQELCLAGPDASAVELGLQAAQQSGFVRERGGWLSDSFLIVDPIPCHLERHVTTTAQQAFENLSRSQISIDVK